MLRPLSSKALKQIKKHVRKVLEQPDTNNVNRVTVNMSFNDVCICASYSMLYIGELNIPLSLEMGIKVYIVFVPVYVQEYFEDFKLST